MNTFDRSPEDFAWCVERVYDASQLTDDRGCYQVVAEAAASLTKAKHGAVVIPTSPGNLRLVGCWGIPTWTPLEFENTRGLIGQAVRERRAQFITNARKHQEEGKEYYESDRETQSNLAVPVVDWSDGSIQAVINVESAEEGHFTPAHEGLIVRLGEVMLKRRTQLFERDRLHARSNGLLTLLEEIPDEVMLIDARFRPVWANSTKRAAHPSLREFLEATGNKTPDIIFSMKNPHEGKEEETCYWLVERNREVCRGCVCEMAMQSKVPVGPVLYFPVHLGMIVELSATPLFSSSGDVIGCLEVARRVTAREKVANVAGELLSGLSEEQLLESIVRCVRTNLSYDRARLYSVDLKEGQLAGVTFAGEHRAEVTKDWFRNRRIPIPPQLLRVLSSGDTAGLLTWGGRFAPKDSEGYRYWHVVVPENTVKADLDEEGHLELDRLDEVACVPLGSDSQHWVVFADFRHTAKAFSYGDLQALTLFGKLGCAALQALDHNKLRFQMAIIGETVAHYAHELIHITMAGRFGVKLYPTLKRTLQMLQEYFQHQPTSEGNEFMARCLTGLSAGLSSRDGLPVKGAVSGVRRDLESELDKLGVQIPGQTLSELARVFKHVDESATNSAAILSRVSTTCLPNLVANLTSLIAVLADQQRVAEHVQIYTEAMRTAFPEEGAAYQVADRIFDVTNLVKLALRTVQRRAYERRVEIVEAYSDDPLYVKGSSGQLFLAWVALLDNALAGAESAPENRRVEVEVKKVREECHVVLRNNGASIPTQELSKIFHEPFTTKDQGTGLGLVLASQWIKTSNGEITHDYDEPSGMTTFLALLPLALSPEIGTPMSSGI